jgi:polysaccharide biosynthesis transport protein
MSKTYESLRRIGSSSNHRSLGPTSDLAWHHADGDNSTFAETANADFDLHSILKTFARRKNYLFGSIVIGLVLAALVCIVMPKRYKAEARIELFKQDTGNLAVNNASNQADTSDSVNFNLNVQTQLAVLKSDTLAWKVMRETNLLGKDQFPPDAMQESGTSLPAPDKRAAQALENFEKNLNVEAVSGTRLIKVSYTDPHPKLAAQVVNQLLSDFVDHNFQVRRDATTKATDWLSHQLVDLKTQVEKSQQRAVQLQKESGIYGEDEQHNVILTRLQRLNEELTTAEADRVLKENVYRLSRGGSQDLIAGMVGAQVQGASSQAANSVVLLNNLRQQEASLNAEYADAAAKYGSEYPRLISLKEKLSAVRASIAEELEKIGERAKKEYQLAASREAAARSAFDEQKTIAARMNDKAVDFLIAKHEADSNRALYDHLLEKLKEADVLAGLHSNELHVLDPAAVPTRPARPNIPLYLAFGCVGGLFLGVVSVFVAETLDHTVRDVSEIENTICAPVLAAIPEAHPAASRTLKSWLKPSLERRPEGDWQRALEAGLQNPEIREAFRALRTSLLLSRPETSARTLLVTSGMPKEGKTFTSFNLAFALAKSGGRVLLVDADLRRGSLSKSLGFESKAGLSAAFSAETPEPPSDYQLFDQVPALRFMPAGGSECDSEVLASNRMAELIRGWRENFTYVVIDTPPILPLTDAAVLSTLVDAVIVVVRFGVTNIQSATRTIRILRDVQAQRIGVLVNGMDVHSPEYYHYSGVHDYKNYASAATAGGELYLYPPPRVESHKRGA